jgi:hypothetical protein
MTAEDQAKRVRAALCEGHADEARREIREFHLDGEIGARLLQECDAREKTNITDGDND